MKKILFIIALSMVLLASCLGAEDKETVIIDEPVDHDLFLSNDTVIIDAEVDGDLFIGAGNLEINAPVTGDAFLAGGMVDIDGPIGGNLIVVGGQVDIEADIAGKIVAFGGVIEISGRSQQVVAAGGRITTDSGAIIEESARLSAGQVTHAGEIKGDLHVSSGMFDNRGTAKTVKREEMRGIKAGDIAEFMGTVAFFGAVLGVLVQFGFLIVGIVFLKWFPDQFLAVESEVRDSPLRNTVVGFIFIIVSIVLAVILAITVVGLPLSAIFTMLVLISLMVSGLFVSLAFGRKVMDILNVETGEIWMLVIGFLLINVLLWVPILGGLLAVVVVSLGFGSIYYGLREEWSSLTGKRGSARL